MPCECYVEKDFQPQTMAVIRQIRDIVQEYMEGGYTLTLRQLYYQFVARDLLENSQRSYNRLGRILSDARMAGLVDWEAIEDRTRYLRSMQHWGSPANLVAQMALRFREDHWKHQPTRIEVWVEKEALVGVFDRVCAELDTPLFACRGYPSQSELWSAARNRFIRYLQAGQNTLILHFGDHDPSGIDMTRDLQDRLDMFMEES